MDGASPLLELGLRVQLDEDSVSGQAEVTSRMCGPGETAVRTSILATWSDMMTGSLAVVLMGPQIPITLDLQVDVIEPAGPGDVISLEGTVLKRGRSVLVCETLLRRVNSSAVLAIAHTTFMASPDPRHVFPDGFRPRVPDPVGHLPVPFAERVGCTVVEPGTAEVARRTGGLNAAGAIQGGVIALAAEEAAFSLAGDAGYHESLGIRYLRPFSVGPARAVARPRGRVCQVRLHDIGTGKLGAVATIRSRPLL